MEDSILSERIKHLGQRVDSLCQDHKDMSTSIARHEQWINQREGEIEGAETRLTNLEAAVGDHQSYIDERKSTLKEFEEMKVTVKGHAEFISYFKGERYAKANLLVQLGILSGILLTLARLFKLI